MLTVKFEKMELLENNNTVEILGNCFGHKVIMEISILQLAKIFGTDKEVEKEVRRSFGNKEYENRCDEAREYVNKFPNIDVRNKEIEFKSVVVENNSKDKKSKDSKTIQIYAEDIVGWNNEGIRIDFSKEIYNQKLRNKKFRIFVSPFSVEFILEKE